MKNNKSRIKILRIIARLNVGGPAKHCLWLFKLDELNYETTLLYGSVEENETELNIPDWKIESYKLKKINFLKRSIGLGDLQTFFKILNVILQVQPEVIHTHTSKAGFHGRLAAFLYRIILTIAPLRMLFKLEKHKLAVFHTFHGHTFVGYFSPLKEWTFRLLERVWARFFTQKIIVISEDQKNDICKRFKIVNEEKCIVINLGIDFKKLSKDKIYPNKGNLKKEFNLPSDSKIVALVSRIAPIKNHSLYIEMAASYLRNYSPKIYFFIIGDGKTEEIENLKNLAKSFDIENNILFTGNRFDLENIYADIDVLVLTSRNEGTPVSLIEGMSAHIPCLSTVVGGVRDLFGYEKNFNLRGYGVSEHNPIALSDELHRILTDHDLRLQITKKAYSFIHDNYSIESLVNKLNSLYKESLFIYSEKE